MNVPVPSTFSVPLDPCLSPSTTDLAVNDAPAFTASTPVPFSPICNSPVKLSCDPIPPSVIVPLPSSSSPIVNSALFTVTDPPSAMLSSPVPLPPTVSPLIVHDDPGPVTVAMPPLSSISPIVTLPLLSVPASCTVSVPLPSLATVTSPVF